MRGVCVCVCVGVCVCELACAQVHVTVSKRDCNTTKQKRRASARLQASSTVFTTGTGAMETRQGRLTASSVPRLWARFSLAHIAARLPQCVGTRHRKARPRSSLSILASPRYGRTGAVSALPKHGDFAFPRTWQEKVARRAGYGLKNRLHARIRPLFRIRLLGLCSRRW